jgi:hypothetical protein
MERPKYPIVSCYMDNKTFLVENDCLCCAERKMIKHMLRTCCKKGFDMSEFPHWLHRKYGTMVIYRLRNDGLMGISLPCVLCRKSIEKYKIQWTAFDGFEWIHSLQSDNIPKSRPTNKQRIWMKFTG